MNATETPRRKTVADVTEREQAYARLTLRATSLAFEAEAHGDNLPQWLRDAIRENAEARMAAYDELTPLERAKLGAVVEEPKAERPAAPSATEATEPREQVARWQDRLATITRYPASARDAEYRAILTVDGRRVVRYWVTEKGMLNALIRVVRNGGTVHDVF